MNNSVLAESVYADAFHDTRLRERVTGCDVCGWSGSYPDTGSAARACLAHASGKHIAWISLPPSRTDRHLPHRRQR